MPSNHGSTGFFPHFSAFGRWLFADGCAFGMAANSTASAWWHPGAPAFDKSGIASDNINAGHRMRDDA